MTKILSIETILSAQLNHFISKDKLWYFSTWVQAILLFRYLPAIGEASMPYFRSCVTSDLKPDGTPYALQIPP